MKLTVLGSGTSSGVPTIGCDCHVCTSDDPRDKRLRPSLLVEYNGKHVVIDTTPDFRTQALRAHIRRLDAVLYTHGHADHVMGLDDIRPFNFKQGGEIPIYASEDTLDILRGAFRYVFENKNRQLNIPQLTVTTFNGAGFELFGLIFQPIPIYHGRSVIHGFRFGNAAYLTDHSDIPESSLAMLHGLDVLFLDALRYKPHPTHSTVQRSLEYVAMLTPKRAFFTHLCHDLGHERAESMLPPHVRLAYDGLEITVEDAT